MSVEVNSKLFVCLADYEAWLGEQPMSAHTRRGYHSRIHQFVRFLHRCQFGEQVLSDADLFVGAAKQFKESLIMEGAKSGSINVTLTAIDNFSRFLKLGSTSINREVKWCTPTRTLSECEQDRLNLKIEYMPSCRDKLLTLLFYKTGLRIGECVRLNISDIESSAQGVFATISANGKKMARRVFLTPDVAAVMDTWLRVRNTMPCRDGALFVNKQGARLSPQAIDAMLRKLGVSARIELNAMILRNTGMLVSQNVPARLSVRTAGEIVIPMISLLEHERLTELDSISESMFRQA